jgi:arylsulfatase A-like enzyme
VKAHDGDIPGVRRPAVLFLIVDCLRADRALAQADLAPSGFLGSLARRGRVFTNAVTVTPTTTPAVASMLTGLYPFEHGLRGLLGFTLPEGTPTVAKALREVGYWTEADVTGPLLPQLGLFRDFEQSQCVDGREATIHGARGLAFAERIRALQAADQPWFSVFHAWDLHEPRQVPAGFRGGAPSRTMYDRALAALDLKLGELFPEGSLDDVTVFLVGDHGENLRLEPRGKLGTGFASLLWWKQTRWATQPVARRVIAHGARSSSKRILRLAPRALITHGHHLFEPLLRVPYVLAGPNIAAGVSDALVAHVDIAPTLAALGGTWFPGGVGALGLPLQGGGGDPERRIVLETAWVTALQGVPQMGIRTPKWKYMEVVGGAAPALFDLSRDPSERRNLVGELPELARTFRDELHTMVADARLGEHMSRDDSELVESRLKDLGYLE